jgi:hypothetical protein
MPAVYDWPAALAAAWFIGQLPDVSPRSLRHHGARKFSQISP